VIRFELYDRTLRLIRMDGRVERIDQKLTRVEIAKRLGAGRIETLEVIQLKHLGEPRLVMYADDAAFSRGLETNPVGTALSAANVAPEEQKLIYGPVLVQPAD
jgi:hypothetical protein